MVSLNEPYGAGLRAALEALRAFEGEVFYENDAVTVRERISVGVFDDRGGFGFGLTGPFVATGHAFPFFGMLQHIVHFTFGTDHDAHRREGWRLIRMEARINTVRLTALTRRLEGFTQIKEIYKMLTFI